MEPSTLALLLGAGLAGGVITAMVGGSSLITFPVLLATGLPPVVAVATNTVSMMPSNFLAVAADREKLPSWRPSFAWIAAVSIVGSGAGAWLLFLTPERMFMRAVPILIGAATVLFALQERIKRWTRDRRDDAVQRVERADRVRLALLAPVAIYVGYFGAAAGVMLLAILSLGQRGDFRAINVLKNLIGGAMSVVAAVAFVAAGVVDWPHAAAMGGGGLLGGYAGGWAVRHVPPRPMRYLVIAVGCTITAVYARRYWFA
jgi:uncharacterized membrane protein YfcA